MAFHSSHSRSKGFRAVSPLLVLLLIVPLDQCHRRLNEAIAASDNMIDNIKEASEIKDALHEFKRISDGEKNTLSSLLAEASIAAKHFNERGRAIRAQKNADTPENRKELAELFSSTAKAMSQFRVLGVKPLKDSYAIKQFDSVFEKFDQNIAIIALAFDCKDLGNDCMKCPPDPPGTRICDTG